jgi:hypothetical protein
MAGVSAAAAPAATTADIVLLVNGIEKVRRPWRLYTQNMAALRSAPPGKRPVGIIGVVPFSPVSSSADDGLRLLLAGVGQASAAPLEVRVMGGDGAVLADATYSTTDPQVRDRALVLAALQQALALAKTPTQCQKLSQ